MPIPNLNSSQKDELIEDYVNIIVDSMSMDDLVSYVSEDLVNFCEKLTDSELKEEISLTLDDEVYEELVENITNPTVLDINNTGGAY